MLSVLFVFANCVLPFGKQAIFQISNNWIFLFQRPLHEFRTNIMIFLVLDYAYHDIFEYTFMSTRNRIIKMNEMIYQKRIASK